MLTQDLLSNYSLTCCLLSPELSTNVMVFISGWILLYSSLNWSSFPKFIYKNIYKVLWTNLRLICLFFLSFLFLRIYTEIFLSTYLTIKQASHKMWTKSGGLYILWSLLWFWCVHGVIICTWIQTLFDLQLWSKKTHHLTAEMSWTRIFLVDEADPSEVGLSYLNKNSCRSADVLTVCRLCTNTWAGLKLSKCAFTFYCVISVLTVCLVFWEAIIWGFVCAYRFCLQHFLCRCSKTFKLKHADYFS